MPGKGYSPGPLKKLEHCFCSPYYSLVEVQRTGSAYQGKNHIKPKIKPFLDFSKTVAKMPFLSVSRESIGILTTFRKNVFRSAPPSRGDRLILRLKSLGICGSSQLWDFPKGIMVIPFGNTMKSLFFMTFNHLRP